MGKNCVYCKRQLEDNSIIDVCNLCGNKVWGEKMFSAIIGNMQKAKDIGDLYQGSVSDDFVIKQTGKKSNSLNYSKSL